MLAKSTSCLSATLRLIEFAQVTQIMTNHNYLHTHVSETQQAGTLHYFLFNLNSMYGDVIRIGMDLGNI